MVIGSIFPPFRHIVVVADKRYPAKVERETPLAFETTAGTFMKASRRKLCDPTIKFEGPFTAEGDMENLP